MKRVVEERSSMAFAIMRSNKMRSKNEWMELAMWSLPVTVTEDSVETNQTNWGRFKREIKERDHAYRQIFWEHFL